MPLKNGTNTVKQERTTSAFQKQKTIMILGYFNDFGFRDLFK